MGCLTNYASSWWKNDEMFEHLHSSSNCSAVTEITIASSGHVSFTGSLLNGHTRNQFVPLRLDFPWLEEFCGCENVPFSCELHLSSLLDNHSDVVVHIFLDIAQEC